MTVDVDRLIVVGKDAEATARNPAGGGLAAGGNGHQGHARPHIEIIAPGGMRSCGQFIVGQRLLGATTGDDPALWPPAVAPLAPDPPALEMPAQNDITTAVRHGAQP